MLSGFRWSGELNNPFSLQNDVAAVRSVDLFYCWQMARLQDQTILKQFLERTSQSIPTLPSFILYPYLFPPPFFHLCPPHSSPPPSLPFLLPFLVIYTGN